MCDQDSLTYIGLVPKHSSQLIGGMLSFLRVGRNQRRSPGRGVCSTYLVMNCKTWRSAFLSLKSRLPLPHWSCAEFSGLALIRNHSTLSSERSPQSRACQPVSLRFLETLDGVVVHPKTLSPHSWSLKSPCHGRLHLSFSLSRMAHASMQWPAWDHTAHYHRSLPP